jgi:hypothetical protein
VTAGAYQTSLKGTQNAFVTELNSSGSAPVFATYLGGSGSDSGNAIGWDGAKSGVIVGGAASSSDFPQRGAVQSGYGGGGDGFATELIDSGSALLYSTYLGGSSSDAVNGLAVQGSGKVLLTGVSSSGNFPTANPLQASLAGSTNAFLADLWEPPPPTANNDGYSMVHDATLSEDAASGVLVNDTSPAGLPLSAVLVSGPSHGTLTLNGDGSFVYTPTADWTGSDSFQYQASDGTQNSNTATVTIGVTNSVPMATNDSYTLPHDQAFTAGMDTGLLLNGQGPSEPAGVLANDSDSDGDSLNAVLYSNPSHGSLTLNPDGSFAYTPNAGYVGSDSFQYEASDGISNSGPATVTLNVQNSGVPVANAHTYGVPENTAESVQAAFGVLSGDSDSDGDPLTASLVSGPSDGTLTLNADGSFTYTPATGYTGSDSFVYAASDGAASSQATVTLNVHATNAAPTANAGSYSIQHDQVLTENAASGVLSYASDSDGDPLSAVLVSGPSDGSLTLNPDGSFTYTPNAGFVGTDSFQYEANDGAANSSPATVTLNVVDPNAPVAVADSYSTDWNNPLSVDAGTGVLANDSDADGDPLLAVLVSGPSNGTLTLNSDGSFDYTPNADFQGTDSFQYEANDGAENSSPATVKITVSNEAPIANGGRYAVLENTTLNAPAGSLQINDYDPDGDAITSSLVSGPGDGTVVVNANGSFVYTPNTGFVGSDSFTYEERDGSLTSSPATVNLTVKSSDTAPVANNDSFTLAHDTPLSASVQGDATDSDGDPLLFEEVSGPSDGTLTLNPDGSFSYTPNAGYYGADSFQYEAYDGTTLSNVATVSLTITNDAPTANPDSYSVLPSGTTSVDAANGVLANDTDGEGDSLTAVLVSGPNYGNLTLNADGSFAYTPGAGFAGSDSFTYEAYDGVNYSSPATVTLTTAPVAQPSSYTVNHDAPYTTDASSGVLAGAYDADGDTLSAVLVSGPSDGTLTLNADGSFTYTPATHYLGEDSFVFEATDGTQVSAPQTVTLNVVDTAPQVYPNDYDTIENQALTVSTGNGVLAEATAPDGGILTAQVASGPSHGTLALQSNGAFTYTPDANWYGEDSFTYEATDGLLTSSPATVTIQVNQDVSITAQGSDPSAVAVGDFDNNGYPDIALADQGLNTVSVYLENDGVLDATPVSTTSVGTAPVALAVGNFLGGTTPLDVAVANSGSNTVSILLGNGTGGFTTGTALSVGSDPVAVVVGDFYGDGQQDIAVANKGSGTVQIFHGNGDGTFTLGTTLNMGGSPDALAAADLNGDGHLDLVVANGASDTVSVYLGQGNGQFASPTTVTVGSNPDSIAAGDLNGDGIVDLAVANGGSNNVSVLIGNGDGRFQPAVNYAVATDPVSIAAGDFDGDGALDLVVADGQEAEVTTLWNEGNGVFLPGSMPTNGVPTAVAAGAFQGGGNTAFAFAEGNQAPQPPAPQTPQPGVGIALGASGGFLIKGISFFQYSPFVLPTGFLYAGGTVYGGGEADPRVSAFQGWETVAGKSQGLVSTGVAGGTVIALATDPGSKYLAVMNSRSNAIQIYSISGPAITLIATVPAPGPLNLFSPNLAYGDIGQNLVLAAAGNGVVYVWKIGANGAPVKYGNGDFKPPIQFALPKSTSRSVEVQIANGDVVAWNSQFVRMWQGLNNDPAEAVSYYPPGPSGPGMAPESIVGFGWRSQFPWGVGVIAVYDPADNDTTFLAGTPDWANRTIQTRGISTPPPFGRKASISGQPACMTMSPNGQYLAYVPTGGVADKFTVMQLSNDANGNVFIKKNFSAELPTVDKIRTDVVGLAFSQDSKLLGIMGFHPANFQGRGIAAKIPYVWNVKTEKGMDYNPLK